MSVLDGRFVVLGVTGSVAAYKTIELARRMTQAGAAVQVIMSRGASEFVQPLTFQALTYRPVAIEMFGSQEDRAAGHVAMGARADVVVVAPATANVLARLAAGFADDLIATTVLATAAPVIVAPAMETHMWANPATRDNVARLRARGIGIVEPEPGELASGTSGEGRLASLERIWAAVEDAVSGGRALAGRQVVVTAGPTVEPIDPVRVLTNRSSGKMGYAVAAAARRAGADVTLVSGPTALTPPMGARLVRVETADQMRDAVLTCLGTADAVVMAAAVADYRPAEARALKLKKRDTGAEFTLTMVENADVLRAIVADRRPGTVVVGFKAETGDAAAEAERLLRDKGVDLVVANDVSEAGSEFGSDTDRVSFVTRDGVERLDLMPKSAVAERLIGRIAQLLAR
ncbi:MAG: bifunctional phosphopantothenoylcysteine decarboxylase/phosphopantothenate--cysteine ligase CoaBC [Candidatus Limnocylindria bacterium]